MSGKQIFVLIAVLSAMVALFSMNIHKAGKPAEGNGHATKTAPVAVIANEEEMLKRAKAKLSPDQNQSITGLETKASEQKTAVNFDKLAEKWDEFKNPGISGWYYYKSAAIAPGVKTWLRAGDKLRVALVNQQDSVSTTAFFDKAIAAYQQVLKTDSTNLDAKTGMGVCYVSGSSNPMQGIGLLLGVIAKDPLNVNANFNLGLFSMRSGQYDKAVGRFQNVVSKAPGGEAYFYLAQAFQNLNRKKEAVEAYKNSKKYIKDAETVTSIDHLIQQLN